MLLHGVLISNCLEISFFLGRLDDNLLSNFAFKEAVKILRNLSKRENNSLSTYFKNSNIEV